MSFDEQEMGDPVINAYEQQRLEDAQRIVRLENENAKLQEILKRYAHGTYKTCQCSSCRALRAEVGGEA